MNDIIAGTSPVYKMPNTHRIVINTQNRISGGDAAPVVPIHISQMFDYSLVKHIKLESSGIIISNTAPVSVDIALMGISQPYSFNSCTNAENTVIGRIPPKFNNGSLFYSQALSPDNQEIYCEGLQGLLTAGQMQLQFLRNDGTPYAMTGNIAMTFVVS